MWRLYLHDEADGRMHAVNEVAEEDVAFWLVRVLRHLTAADEPGQPHHFRLEYLQVK